MTTISKCYNVAQLRLQLWTELKQKTIRLKKSLNEDDVLRKDVIKLIRDLKVIEKYWAFPGLETVTHLQGLLKTSDLTALNKLVADILRTLVSDEYRSNPTVIPTITGRVKKKSAHDSGNHYFEVLFVDALTTTEAIDFKSKLADLQKKKDQFTYIPAFVNSFQDAIIALILNPNIQACVIRYDIQYKSSSTNGILKNFISHVHSFDYSDRMESELGPILGNVIRELRPELDIYFVTDKSVNDIDDDALENFRRIFYRKEDLQELHLSLQRGIQERFQTPFFSALQNYSQKPTGVFHAMPISRGNSVFKSNWIKDFGDFYGRNLFLAETSSTTGGLDSLLQPTGPLKKAQELAAEAFGSKRTYFATNGTSTANKIVVQALIEPGDVVLVDRDCHKSHHYGLVLAGAYVVYLDSYPVEEYSLYGAVPLNVIKSKLLQLKEAGRLDKVKMVLLTNCTFDGVVYNVEKVMEEILAIKPDLIFLWDEAWFAFAAFTYTFRKRTAMFVANKLANKYKTKAYREEYESHIKLIEGTNGQVPNMPDPDKVKIRVYSTQSTHKTLSSLRQGSMIHIYDQDFSSKAEESFHEAYMTHTSTSPNYQILASLDIGRRQVLFEGFELVEKSIEMAMVLRARINDHPRLRKYFKVLTVKDIIGDSHRESQIKEYYDIKKGWNRLEDAWSKDEFVLDPTKITLFIGNTGVDGDTFKNKYLMDRFNIQINKTSRNTVLFMTNIGTTRSSVSYLIGVLLKISKMLDDGFNSMSEEELRIEKQRIKSLTKDTPPLPHFSYFHDSFRALPGIPGGNIREAYFLAYKEKRCEFLKLENCQEVMDSGKDIVSASFVIPYPPGFPVLVPGQVMTPEILDFLQALDVKEIHGYRPELGLRIFTENALNRLKSRSSMMARPVAPKEQIKSSQKERK